MAAATMCRHRVGDPPADGRSGSGSAIGVAIMFPMLMLVIVALQAITTATRSEQALQAAADQAARAAALCCHRIGDAYAMALSSLESVGQQRCTNDVRTQSRVAFIDADGESLLDPPEEQLVLVGGALVLSIEAGIDTLIMTETGPVPAGGLVRVTMPCRLPATQLGVFSLGGRSVERYAVSVASIDPFRQRHLEPEP